MSKLNDKIGDASKKQKIVNNMCGTYGVGGEQINAVAGVWTSVGVGWPL